MATGVGSTICKLEDYLGFVDRNRSELELYNFCIKECQKKKFLEEIEESKRVLKSFEETLKKPDSKRTQTESGSSSLYSGKKTRRTGFTESQKKLLEDAFADGSIYDKQTRRELSSKLGLEKKVVIQWASNRVRRSKDVKRLKKPSK